MDKLRIDLLDLAEQRLNWATHRQEVLAQNIANANTPGFRPRDVRSFADALAGTAAVTPVRTQPNHLAGPSGVLAGDETVDRRHTQSPDGNAVAIDEQLVKLADTDTIHRFATSIYHKYLGMFATALGRTSSS
jgi:flagellar basal-body rod protein FlgB